MGTDAGIKQYINIHNPPQELYDLLPFKEKRNGNTFWKENEDVTWFKPREDAPISFTVSLHDAPVRISHSGKRFSLNAWSK